MWAECWLCMHTFVLRRNSRWDSTTDACRCGWSADYACTSSSYAKSISFAKKRPVGFDDRHSSRVDVGAGGGLLILACCIPSASLRKSDLLREKTADQVVRGLKVKLKTSPTKVRLASLKKIWKQADRRHERRDVAVAESADFAAFDLCNRTSLDGHSNTCRTGFHLAGSMPNSDDVRRREIPKKIAKNRKNSAITSRRDHCVKVDKFRCHFRGACAAEISLRELVIQVARGELVVFRPLLCQLLPDRQKRDIYV